MATNIQNRGCFRRKWKLNDVMRALVVALVHLLCLLAPFHYNLEALRLSLLLGVVTGFGITFSYHRNLAHQSFKLPKWLEYLFAYLALLALEGDPIDWVSTHRFHHKFTDSDRDPHSPMEGFWFSHILWIFDTDYVKAKCGRRNNVADLRRQWFYRFLQNTQVLHITIFCTILYDYGGLPYLIWVVGFGGTFRYHGTLLVNSACHIWGSQAWKTKDTSRNIWWLSIYTLGESWHNNHHAFESSARHGLEWWQIDLTWYFIRFLEALGLATDVKLPSQSIKEKIAFAH